ncbi:MAG: TIM barrel protein [Verrucomicrobia bacterium]|nr:TIM barrel protein [Verrucomicrobiota bacterium]
MKQSIRPLGLLAALALATLQAHAADAGLGKNFKGPVGLQLWSLREQFAANGAPATMDTVKKFGIKYAEFAGVFGQTPEKMRALADERGIKLVSGHFHYVTVFNHAGEALAKHGLKFFYHCHGFEFQPHSDGTLMDLIIKETNPKFVRFQMDVLWVVFPGQDPVKLLEKYPGRWELMHLKDLRKGVATGPLTGKTEKVNDVALGTGQMNWPAILAAAKKSGVKWYFIEDESPTSEQQIPQSLKFLESVKF